MESSKNISYIIELLENLDSRIKIISDRLDNIELTIKSKSNITDGKNINQMIDFVILDKGFNLDKKFILECLNKTSILGEIELFQAYYFRDNMNLPLKREDKNNYYYFYNEEWKNNIDKYIENTILSNIINTYLEIMQTEDVDDILDYNYKIKMDYVIKLQTSKQYKKNLIKSILELI